jgi:hypothetical protein
MTEQASILASASLPEVGTPRSELPQRYIGRFPSVVGLSDGVQFAEVGMTRYRFQNDTEILPTEWMVADVTEDSLKVGSDVVFAVTMDHVVKVWGVAWNDEAAVIARFDREKLEYACRAVVDRSSE